MVIKLIIKNLPFKAPYHKSFSMELSPEKEGIFNSQVGIFEEVGKKKTCKNIDV